MAKWNTVIDSIAAKGKGRIDKGWLRGAGWEDDRNLINSWYQEYKGRDMTQDEWTNYWGPKTKNIGVNFDWIDDVAKNDERLRVERAGGYEQYKSQRGEVAKAYEQLLGRTPSDKEIDDWLNSSNDTAKIREQIANSSEAKNVAITPENKANPNNPEYVDPETGKKPNAPKPEEVDPNSWIRELYASMQPEIARGVTSAAAQRGGLDTGGYLTAQGKAQASTWQDMLKSIIGQTNVSNAAKENTRQFDVTQKNQKDALADQYKLLTAQSQASQPGGWEMILGGAGAGAALGPWGALGGALLGWGAKQGLFK